MPLYVVNAGRGRSMHIMESNRPTTPNPNGLDSLVANLPWFGGNGKATLCGLLATRHVDCFTLDEVSCRECEKRWQLSVAAQAAGKQRAAQQEAARQEAARNQAARDQTRRQRAPPARPSTRPGDRADDPRPA